MEVNVMIGLIILLLFLLAVGAGIVILQIFLSKKESKWSGLILPIIAFCFSLFIIMSIALFAIVPGTGEVSQDGVIIEQFILPPLMNASEAITVIAINFLLCNIPTAILLAIYAACRDKYNRQRALDKMSVQDLE